MEGLKARKINSNDMNREREETSVLSLVNFYHAW
jgi:hypothetical protein